MLGCDDSGPLLAVDIKFRSSSMRVADVDALIGRASRLNLPSGMLPVASAPLSSMAKQSMQSRPAQPRVEIVTWIDERDDAELAAAMERRK